MPAGCGNSYSRRLNRRNGEYWASRAWMCYCSTLPWIARRSSRSRTIGQMPSSSEQRPDPDLLLLKVKQQEAEAKRGKLRIYFGSSAGVGKTYAMLATARALKTEGRDVVIGVAETHGRAETAALLKDLEARRQRRMRM